jgi:2-polyprenyl-6-methoxyphenol hydroxylase-like FAD-dependent oxidoreductase
MSQSSKSQVLIAGAGPTGLALACHLLRLGVHVRVVDKAAGRSVTSKAIGLQYRVSEILALMGVADRFLAVSGTPTNVNMYVGGRRLVTLRFTGFCRQSGQEAFSPRALMIPQSETERLLGELLRERGGQIEWGVEFIDFEQDDRQVVGRLRHADGPEEQTACDYLVSCEGAHSTIRKQAGLTFTGKTYPLAFLMADVQADWDLDHDENHVWFHPEGSFAALPLPRPRTWRMFIELTSQRQELPEHITLDIVRRIMAERIGDTGTTLSNPTWISEFRINCRLVDQYRLGRVLLAGDAAHIHSPTGGQGITTGIQDATNLAWKLGRVLRGAPERLLDTYQEERRPKAQEVLRETDRTTTVMFAPTTATRLLRDYLVLPVLRNGWVQRRMFAKLSQLHVNYRGCRLSRDEDRRWPPASRLKAGDRAPDVAGDRADDGRRTTLFELLHPLRPVVLLGAEIPPEQAERLLPWLDALEIDGYVVAAADDARWTGHRRALLDRHGDLRGIYGMQGRRLCLLRPDGHLGLVQRNLDEESLRRYLAELCPERLLREEQSPALAAR